MCRRYLLLLSLLRHDPGAPFPRLGTLGCCIFGGQPIGHKLSYGVVVYLPLPKESNSRYRAAEPCSPIIECVKWTLFFCMKVGFADNLALFVISQPHSVMLLP